MVKSFRRKWGSNSGSSVHEPSSLPLDQSGNSVVIVVVATVVELEISISTLKTQNSKPKSLW